MHIRHKNRLLLAACGLAGVSLAGPLAAEEELGAGFSLSSNVALTSNYVFRGWSENDEEPSIQGGFDIAHTSGIYFGTWAAAAAAGALELDYFIGYGHDLTDTLSLDVGMYYYGYPDAEGDPDTLEFYAGLGLALAVADGDFYVHYSDDYFGREEASIYLETNWSIPIAAGFYGIVRAGYLITDDLEDEENGVDSIEGFDYAIGLGYEYGTLDFSLIYADHEEDDDDQVAFTIARSF
ncbi:hypothetical protein CKO15_02705 [Halorhodospira abdelmalekii]|uniref:TorF family putative porin n=1 Tax=Halorhodospira abdelmalekii TaxID=421629 RepID=UPI001907FF70|nr:TorF family putative porin [Halorhodospira abdelmalekii]MBK1734209.1 hypothetical protein [Halorhodospira abdelmalekii]